MFAFENEQLNWNGLGLCEYDWFGDSSLTTCNPECPFSLYGHHLLSVALLDVELVQRGGITATKVICGVQKVYSSHQNVGVFPHFTTNRSIGAAISRMQLPLVYVTCIPHSTVFELKSLRQIKFPPRV
ncbi:hypothetical protein J6590_020653 [Homalodisca vitripennis]|nr:hypothetical protein J6590_020653 [Homalodisca vitripennis]